MPDPAYRYSATVTAVHDGDTFTADVDLGFGVWLRKQTFRLLGCNGRCSLRLPPQVVVGQGARSGPVFHGVKYTVRWTMTPECPWRRRACSSVALQRT